MTFSKFKMVTAIVCSLVLELCSLRYLVQILHPLHGDVSILRNSRWPPSAILDVLGRSGTIDEGYVF